MVKLRPTKIKKKDDESSDEELVLHSDSDSDSDYDSEDADTEDYDYEIDEEEEDDSEEDDSEEDDDEEDDDEELKNMIKNKYKSRSELENVITEMFPSKYVNEKYKKKNKEDKKEKKNKKEKKEKKNKNKKKKRVEESETESDTEVEEYIEGEEEENDDEGKINILFQLGNGDMFEEEEEYNDDEDGDDCTSDDEKIFMKENYQDIKIPDGIKKKKKKKKNKSIKSEEDDENSKNPNIENEYLSLVSLRKEFNSKLEQHPNDKTLKKSVKDYDNRIKKLVKESRVSNAKKYHKLIQSGNKNGGNEIDYFKKKLSHKEQTRVMNDLKEINKSIKIDKPYRLTLLEANIPPQYKACALQKLNVLKTMEPGDPEYYKLKHWVDAFMKIPFGKHKSLDVNMSDGVEKCNEFMVNAKQALDKCTYGLNDAKTQIMQMLGQWLSNPSATGTAIAIKGPMGTGKTTLVKEGISQILGREFAFIALGGNGDSSYLEGHSYTYEGSTWGKIVQILMDCKSMNPVIYFDELDKVSDTPRGEEIIGILTHLTDVSQNSQYHDKYFSELSFDLSKCLFIFSYNDESKVNPILRDRMYRVETKGYSTKEKMIIAKDYLLPKIREQVGFKEGELIISDNAIDEIITSESLTMKEDGVRNLKRCLEVIHTKLNLFRLVNPENKKIVSDIELEVTFPFTVEKDHIKVILKKNDSINPSLFGLYI